MAKTGGGLAVSVVAQEYVAALYRRRVQVGDIAKPYGLMSYPTGDDPQWVKYRVKDVGIDGTFVDIYMPFVMEETVDEFVDHEMFWLLIRGRVEDEESGVVEYIPPIGKRILLRLRSYELPYDGDVSMLSGLVIAVVDLQRRSSTKIDAKVYTRQDWVKGALNFIDNTYSMTYVLDRTGSVHKVNKEG